MRDDLFDYQIVGVCRVQSIEWDGTHEDLVENIVSRWDLPTGKTFHVCIANSKDTDWRVFRIYENKIEELKEGKE